MLEEFRNADLLVVGAGLFGLTIAHRAAQSAGLRVLVIEKRPHIGGNAWSRIDPDTGIEVHEYGSHIFHTSNKEVWDYVNRFSTFNNYRHTVWTVHRGQVYSMPINLATICSFFGRRMGPSEARNLISEQAAEIGARRPENLEEKAISLIGRELYEAFIRGYTQKQWDTDPKFLSEHIINRLPIRLNFSNGYFKDEYQGIPVAGYGRLCERMAAHPKIHVVLNTDYFAVRHMLDRRTPLVYTGPIDRYFGYRAGRLGWRTLRFEREVLPVDDYQGASVMNYADLDVPFTRVHEFKHFHPERDISSGKTIVFREYSLAATGDDEPYYPIDTVENRKLYDVYRKLAASEPTTIFAGRLGTYRYIDMHQAIGAALNAFERKLMPLFSHKKPFQLSASDAV